MATPEDIVEDEHEDEDVDEDEDEAIDAEGRVFDLMTDRLNALAKVVEVTSAAQPCEVCGQPTRSASLCKRVRAKALLALARII